MTYVSKREKVFDLPEQEDTSSISVKKSETRLKRFPSVSDKRAWTSEECQRYQHFYGLVSGSESNISKSSSFKYIPFDVLLAILMAEKDAYIQELLDRQDERSCGGGKANVLYKAEGFEDSDDDREALIRKDAEVVALKNKIAGLESELEDYRDTLTKAMHKLESMDTIISENNLLREKIKYSEETIKCLEERKMQLEKELAYFRKSYDHATGLEEKKRFFGHSHNRNCGDYEQIIHLSSERDILLQQVEELQKELEKTRISAHEMEVLRKLSETTSSSLEEISKENESYRKKLEGMKCLEKHVEELKKQAHVLTDKYKRESQKANDQLKQINMNSRELQMLREEKDKLQKRVNELVTYETQYLNLQAKLRQVEIILDENETLNKKLIQLDTLELENEELKMKIDQLKFTEMEAVEDKERIVRLQCAVVNQEDEIKKMVRQIEDLSQGYGDKNEVHRIKNELEEKNEKLKQYEKQLSEIPVLESEIDELRFKLQKCIDDFKTDKDLLKRLQEELEACRRRCLELEEMTPMVPVESDSVPEEETCEELSSTPDCIQNNELKITVLDKGENTEDISKQDAESQCLRPEYKEQSTEALIIDLKIRSLEEVEEQNRILKSEVEKLQLKLSEINLDDFLSQMNDLKEHLHAKDKLIGELKSEIIYLRKELSCYDELRQNFTYLEEEMKNLKDVQLEKDVELHQDILNQAKKLEDSLRVEKKARKFAMNMAREMKEKLVDEIAKRKADKAVTKLQKEEANIGKQLFCLHFKMEVNHLKNCNNLSRRLIEELKAENQFLREAKGFSDCIETTELKNLLRKSRAEVKLLRSLSKPELQSECEALQEQVQRLLKETDSLVDEIRDLKSALDSEKTGKDSLENELINLQAELSACVAAGNEVLSKEVAARDATIVSLKKELADARNAFENSANDAQVLRDDNVKLFNSYNNLKSRQKDLEHELNWLLTRTEELNSVIKGHEEKQNQHSDEVKALQEKVSEQENELVKWKELVVELKKNIKELEVLLTTKEVESENFRKISTNMKNEVNKLNSEMEVLKSRLSEKEGANVSQVDYEKDLEEKYALEEALRKIENELDELKMKLNECKDMEEEMTNLKGKRDSLLEKMLEFESEIDILKKKLSDFEVLKTELEELKAEKKLFSLVHSEEKSPTSEMSDLLIEFQQQKTEIENLKSENENLWEELEKSKNLLDVCKKLQTTIPQGQVSLTMEFFTPPTLLSPRSSDPQESELECQNAMALETHRKEITNLENHYESKIQLLEKTNAEKLKSLMVQHEREVNCRSKTFYESINSMKSSYESDIRKLVDKHKSSVMKLQGLHEDEIQELNTNYETQMEAMQTQNENVINDLKTELLEKCKQLTEQHEQELKELEVKYEEILREKEARYLAEKSNIETSLTQSTNDMKDVHQQTVDSLSQFYQTNILELEEKHAKEMKKCKKNNLRRIELMKNKYEDLLVEERKKYEEQLEEMLQQLKKGEQGDTSENDVKHCVQKKAPAHGPRLEFLEVLQKIINEGLESLTFEELILVHSKTCFMPENIGEGGEKTGEPSEKVGDGCRHKALMGTAKEELLKRIFALEHELVIKQLETHEAIVNMETAEKYRIQELKNALCNAQQKNVELKRLASNQTKLQMDMKIEKYMSDREVSLHETHIMEKVKELERVKAEKRHLEDDLQKEKTNVKHLTATLEAEKERFRSQRKRDSEYIESIRLRLEEALNHEQMMESQLDYEARFRAMLESEIQSLQKSFNLVADFPSAQIPVESKAIKDSKNFDQCETAKEEIHSRSKSKHRSKSKALHNL